MIDRILKTLQDNSKSEDRGWLWGLISNKVSSIEINEQNLENMCVNDLTHGCFNGTNDQKDRPTLIMLDHALGINGIKNPEGYRNGIYPHTSADKSSDTEILSNIEKAIGFKIHLPSFIGGLNETKTDYGIYSMRHLCYLWVAKRIIDMLPERTCRIIEIGGGIGLLGYFLDKLGYYDYTVIDLAHQNAIQSYFLYKNLPERDIILSKETDDPYDDRYKKSIKILHTSDFKNAPSSRYDIMINMDGLTEFSINTAKAYAHSNCAPLFFSINHEVNFFRVIQIVPPIKKLVYRNLFWLRKGYVEELYSI